MINCRATPIFDDSNDLIIITTIEKISLAALTGWARDLVYNEEEQIYVPLRFGSRTHEPWVKWDVGEVIIGGGGSVVDTEWELSATSSIEYRKIN